MNIFAVLGFAKKSKKLVCGMTNCLHAIRKKKAKLVIISKDAGGTRKKVMRECLTLNIPFVEFGTKDQFLKYLGNSSCYWAVMSAETADDLIKNKTGGD